MTLLRLLRSTDIVSHKPQMDSFVSLVPITNASFVQVPTTVQPLLRHRSSIVLLLWVIRHICLFVVVNVACTLMVLPLSSVMLDIRQDLMSIIVYVFIEKKRTAFAPNCDTLKLISCIKHYLLLLALIKGSL